MNQNPNGVQNPQPNQPKEKKVLTLEEQEKSNKKIALIIMMSFCILFVVMGLVGGVVKFIRFVDEMNPQEQVEETTPENEFFKDGKLSFRNGGEVIAQYQCQHSSCGWAFATSDDAQYDLRTPSDNSDGTYELKGIVNNRYAIIYDDDNPNSTSNIIIYDIQDNKNALELTGIKNYNTDTGGLYIAKNKEGKWGIISLASSKIEEIISYQFDYIGVVLQNGESIKEQQLYAAVKNGSWSIISTNKSSGNISGEFTEPIVAYNHKYVVTKSPTSGIFYNLYTLHGQSSAIEKDMNDILLPGYNILVTYTKDNSNKRVVVYDAANGAELFNKKFSALQGVTYEVNDNKLLIKADGEKIYDTDAKSIAVTIDDENYIKEVEAPTNSNNNEEDNPIE